MHTQQGWKGCLCSQRPCPYPGFHLHTSPGHLSLSVSAATSLAQATALDNVRSSPSCPCFPFKVLPLRQQLIQAHDHCRQGPLSVDLSNHPGACDPCHTDFCSFGQAEALILVPHPAGSAQRLPSRKTLSNEAHPAHFPYLVTLIHIIHFCPPWLDICWFGCWSSRYGASQVAQVVKNPPAMWETWVRSLGLEDPLEKGKATHSSILAWRIPGTVHGVAKSRTQLSDFHLSLR